MIFHGRTLWDMARDVRSVEDRPTRDLGLTRSQATCWLVGGSGIPVSLVAMFLSRPEDVVNDVGATGVTISCLLIFVGYVLPFVQQQASWSARWSAFRSWGYPGSRLSFRARTEQAADRLDHDPTSVRRTIQVLYLGAGAAFVVGMLLLIHRGR
jgi:hypothetical protein